MAAGTAGAGVVADNLSLSCMKKGLVMKLFGNIIAVVMMGLVPAGCVSNRITKYYDFSAYEYAVTQKDLVVGARLEGAVTEGEKEGWYAISQRKSPYALIIYVLSKTGYYQSAGIVDIRLTDKHDTPFHMPPDMPKTPAPFKDVNYLYLSEMIVADLELPYEPIDLAATVEITTRSNATFRIPIVFQFEPLYSEKKTNDTWTRMTTNR